MSETINLSGVPETMLQTVYARAKETKTRGAIHDDKAVELVDKLQHRFRYAGKVDRFAHGEAPLFLDSAGIGRRLENANPCRVKMPPSRQPLYYTKEESLWLYCSRAAPPCQAARGRMETYSAEKFACWRFLRHIGCK